MKSFVGSFAANTLCSLPSFVRTAMPICVCSPLPASPIIGFALKLTSRPLPRKISRTIVRTKISLSAACTASAKRQSISSCSQTWVMRPLSSICALSPPTSLWPISTPKPYLSSSSTHCSSAQRTAPCVRSQYCSCMTWDALISSISASSNGVFTQNSSSVAEVNSTSVTSAPFTSSPEMLGCAWKISSNSFLT